MLFKDTLAKVPAAIITLPSRRFTHHAAHARFIHPLQVYQAVSPLSRSQMRPPNDAAVAIEGDPPLSRRCVGIVHLTCDARNRLFVFSFQGN